MAGDELTQFFKQNITFKLYISNTDLQIMKQSGYTYDVYIYRRMDRKSKAVDMTATQVTVETLDKEERGAEAEAACRLLFIAPTYLRSNSKEIKCCRTVSLNKKGNATGHTTTTHTHIHTDMTEHSNTLSAKKENLTAMVNRDMWDLHILTNTLKSIRNIL